MPGNNTLLQVKSKIIELASQQYMHHEIYPITITDNTNLDTDLCFDSLDKLELCAMIESELNVTIPTGNNIETIGDLVRISYTQLSNPAILKKKSTPIKQPTQIKKPTDKTSAPLWRSILGRISPRQK